MYISHISVRFQKTDCSLKFVSIILFHSHNLPKVSIEELYSEEVGLSR